MATALLGMSRAEETALRGNAGISNMRSYGSVSDGTLFGTFALKKQFDLASAPSRDWDIGVHSDEFLTHSCANYVDDGSTVFSRDEKLVLRVSSACESGGCLNSGRIMSKESFKYGLYVFTARVPKCNYLWPAFWLLPEDKDGNGRYGGWPCSGEIDVLETVDGNVFGSFNLVAGYGSDNGCGREAVCNECRPGYCTSTSLKNSSSGAYFVEDVDCGSGQDSWQDHTWVLNWQPEQLTTWIDPILERDDTGHIISVKAKQLDAATTHGFPTWKTYKRASTPTWLAADSFMNQCHPGVAAPGAPFDIGFKLVLNIAIGGYDGAGCSWGEKCSTACAGAIGSEMVVSELSVWQTA